MHAASECRLPPPAHRQCVQHLSQRSNLCIPPQSTLTTSYPDLEPAKCQTRINARTNSKQAPAVILPTETSPAHQQLTAEDSSLADKLQRMPHPNTRTRYPTANTQPTHHLTTRHKRRWRLLQLWLLPQHRSHPCCAAPAHAAATGQPVKDTGRLCCIVLAYTSAVLCWLTPAPRACQTPMQSWP